MLRGHEGEGTPRAQDLRAARHDRQGRWQIRGRRVRCRRRTFSDGLRRLFWPSDLEEIASAQPSLWRSVVDGQIRG